jgi:hypothetical protein
MRCCFIIFAHNDLQTNEDVEDLINNISFFHNDCDFIVNHPTLTHPKVRVRHRLGPVDHSSFIFGAFIDVLQSLSGEEINSFDHFCLVSANQYFINKIEFKKDTNYVQFINTEKWDDEYNGKDFNKEIIGNPIIQPWGNWDPLNLYKKFNIDKPMASNWECLTLTNKALKLAKENVNICTEVYPNQDRISTFVGYMALLSGQNWEFPPHFGTYDPSNPQPKNWILTEEQVIQKYLEGYFSVKRTNYPRSCHIKNFIRNNLMNL